MTSVLPLPRLASAGAFPLFSHAVACLHPHHGRWPPGKRLHVYNVATFDSLCSSTNARFIESLNSDYKPSIDRVQRSRRDASDDEDEDALFAELEAELENADSAALRDRGIKDLRAQLRRFSSQ